MAYKLAVKTADGKIHARKRGRQPAGSIKGYFDENDVFQEGEAPKLKPGRKPKSATVAVAAPKPAAVKRGRPAATTNSKPATAPATGVEATLRTMIAEEVAKQLEEAIRKMLS